MNYSTNYNMNKPQPADQYNIDHWNQNTDIIDTALQDIRSGTDSVLKETLLNFCYPIGSLYWSSNSTDPSTLFGGTWTRIKDRFVWAMGDSDTVNDTGGEKTHTLTTTETPSHTHTISGSTGSESSHTHSLGNHTHPLNGSGASTSHVSLTGSLQAVTTSGERTGIVTGCNTTSNAFQAGASAYRGTYTFDASHSHTLSGNTSTPSSNTSGSGTSHSHGVGTLANSSTGGDGAHNNMPPYINKYCWERTA